MFTARCGRAAGSISVQHSFFIQDHDRCARIAAGWRHFFVQIFATQIRSSPPYKVRTTGGTNTWRSIAAHADLAGDTVRRPATARRTMNSRRRPSGKLAMLPPAAFCARSHIKASRKSTSPLALPTRKPSATTRKRRTLALFASILGAVAVQRASRFPRSHARNSTGALR